MAKFMKHEVIGRILEIGLVPIFYNGDLEVAKKISKPALMEEQRL